MLQKTDYQKRNLPRCNITNISLDTKNYSHFQLLHCFSEITHDSLMMSRGWKCVQNKTKLDRLYQVIHQTMTQKTNKTVFAVMTPFEIKIMFQIMRLKESPVTKSKMILQSGFMQD